MIAAERSYRVDAVKSIDGDPISLYIKVFWPALDHFENPLPHGGMKEPDPNRRDVSGSPGPDRGERLRDLQEPLESFEEAMQ